MDRIDAFKFHQIQNQIIQIGCIVDVEVYGTVEYAVVAMHVDGTHADIKLLGDCVGNGIVNPKSIPSVHLNTG